MSVKQWVLTVAAVLAVLTTTPALANSLCGNRFDLGRGPRLTILGLTSDQGVVFPGIAYTDLHVLLCKVIEQAEVMHVGYWMTSFPWRRRVRRIRIKERSLFNDFKRYIYTFCRKYPCKMMFINPWRKLGNEFPHQRKWCTCKAYLCFKRFKLFFCIKLCSPSFWRICKIIK